MHRAQKLTGAFCFVHHHMEVPVPMHSKSPAVAALKAAFPHTIPIFAGFLFLGMTYGVYMRTSGFSFWYPMIMSIVIFGGSLNL